MAKRPVGRDIQTVVIRNNLKHRDVAFRTAPRDDGEGDQLVRIAPGESAEHEVDLNDPFLAGLAERGDISEGGRADRDEGGSDEDNMQLLADLEAAERGVSQARDAFAAAKAEHDKEDGDTQANKAAAKQARANLNAAEAKYAKAKALFDKGA